MIKINHTELPCIFDDRDKGWGGGENNRPLPYSKSNKEWNKNDRK